MDSTTLFLGLIFGSVGMGYFVYGKKQQQIMAFISGISLCVVPYAVSNIPLLVIVGIVLIALPFVIKF
ncbi:MAG: hypothetical protein KKD44_07635 [Proteobacteria bacterium]|nr:hypothetical protein [Pseudomonadota bacterium]